MGDEFNIEDVHRLVDEVVGGRIELPASPPPTTNIPFGIYDTSLFPELISALDKTGLHQADIQMVLDHLRTHLTQTVSSGTIQNLHSLTLNCKRCPALKDAHIPLGNLVDPDVIFILDHPESSWPEELLAILSKVGISSDRAMLSFATRCKTLTGRQPSSNEVANCSSYLYAEIQLLSPKLIVPLGITAASDFISSLKISEDHGNIYWIGPWAIMPIYALGYLGRRESAEKELISDLTKAKMYLYGS